MRHVEPRYREIIVEQGILDQLLTKAHERFPDAVLEFCGVETSWYDCLQCVEHEGILTVYFSYNIGKDTRTDTIDVPLKPQILMADYAQIEQRILASQNLSPVDIHNKRAAREGLTRRAAKALNFLDLYGGQQNEGSLDNSSHFDIDC